MRSALLEAIDLTKQYPGKEQIAVANISFTLAAGEIMALLGPNGAGKTTIIKMILGLVTPTAGKSVVGGYDMSDETQRRQIARHVGAVLEGARNVYWRLSARENLHYFGALRGLRGRQLKFAAQEKLQLVGLGSVADDEVRHFSRGMQQKVAIAAALMSDPEVLLLDEPTLGLDVASAKALEQVMVSLAASGKGILLTTHQMGLAERLSHKLLVINQGRVIAYEPAASLLRRFNVRATVDINLEGEIPASLLQRLLAQFPLLTFVSQNGTTRLSWAEPTQRQVAQLYQYLDEQGQTIVSVQRREASLEEIFLALVNEEMATA